MKPPALTMCGPTDVITGEHVHVWCDRCANFETPCAVTHNACPDCRILRTIMQLSRHWYEFMWDYRMDKGHLVETAIEIVRMDGDELRRCVDNLRDTN